MNTIDWNVTDAMNRLECGVNKMNTIDWNVVDLLYFGLENVE